MGIYRLTPTDLSDPKWAASSVRETIWVSATSRNEARQLAALKTARVIRTRRYLPKILSPWLDQQIARCDLDQAKTEIPAIEPKDCDPDRRSGGR